MCLCARARVPRGGGGGVARAPVCMTVSSFGAMNFFVMSQKLVSGRKLVCLFFLRNRAVDGFQ